MRCNGARRADTARSARRSSVIGAALLAGVATLAVVTAAAPGGVALAQTDDTTARAASAFERGRVAFDRGEYDSALREFRAAIELVPSPNTRLYIARSLRGAGRNAEAYTEFTRAAAEADARAVREPRYAPTASAARADARGLLGRIAVVNVLVSDAPPDAVVRLNGAPIERAQWNTDLPFEPGMLQVDAEAPGRAPFHSTPNLPAGMVTRIEVRLAPGGNEAPLLVTPEPQPPAVTPTPTPVIAPPVRQTPPPPIAPIAPVTPPPRRASPLVPVGAVSLSLGLAAGVGAIIAGASAQALYDDFRAQCGDGPCPADTPGLAGAVERGRNRVVLTNVAIATGSVLTALGAILIVAGRAWENAEVPASPVGAAGRRRHRAAAARRASPAIAPLLDIAHGMAGVQGAF